MGSRSKQRMYGISEQRDSYLPPAIGSYLKSTGMKRAMLYFYPHVSLQLD